MSVLWTVFATGLLAGGLALRNRALFYSAYGLFALTAGKVVFWDLQTFSIPYRMLSFLALGLAPDRGRVPEPALPRAADAARSAHEPRGRSCVWRASRSSRPWPPPRPRWSARSRPPVPAASWSPSTGDVYEGARADLGDLRVVDASGAEVPYLLERVEDAAALPAQRPRIGNRSFLRGQEAQATLDFGAPTLKTELTLALSGDNFRRRVKVEGRARTDPRWATLTDAAYVFAVPGRPPRATRRWPCPRTTTSCCG